MEEINILQIQQLEEGLGGVAGVAKQAEMALGSLDNKLLTLRLNFGKLRAAIERAFAPITSHVATALNGIVRGLTDFVNDAGAVIAAIFGTVQEKAVVTAKSSGKALRRSLADFDEINRLNGSTGGGGGSTVTWQTISKPLTPQLQKTVDAIREILAPLQAISFDRARAAFAALGEAIAALGQTIGSGLLWAWHNVLVPLAQWTIEAAVPAAVDALSGAFSFLNAVLAPVLDAIRGILPAFQPAVRFLGSTALLILDTLKAQFAKLAEAFTLGGGSITQALTLLGTAFAGLLETVRPIFTALRDSWLAVMGAFGDAAVAAVRSILTGLTGLTEFLSGSFTGNWTKAWEGIRTVFKGAVNGIIGLINAMLSGLVGGVNAAVKALNRFRVNLPQWLPGVGGKSFGFSLPTLSVPQIPYLAQGAVLPANKPFLAMVGDQKHGTNIEAPLGVIQEAVALVMEDQLLTMMAGFEALLAENRLLREVVEGIEIGDAVLGRAANRYNTRLATMRGDA